MSTVNLRFELNTAGGRDLLRSDEVLAELLDRGERIAAAANALNVARHDPARPSDLPDDVRGVQAQPALGRNRARVEVVTVTYQAMEDQLHHHTLEAAIDAGA